MKKCSRCQHELPSEAFGKSTSAKDGLMHRCKECNRKVAEEHYTKLHGTKESRQDKQNVLYEYIKSLKKSGHTLSKIAEATGLDQSSISYYLNGKRSVGMQAVEKYEHTLKAGSGC